MRLLDLFCGAGGAAMGYYRAGFTEIVGIDIKPQPRYPFEFIQANALTPPVDLSAFDAIHASPPCQDYTPCSNAQKARGIIYQDFVSETRALLQSSGKPYIIENVNQAPLLRGSIYLCGLMFGLRLLRHRRFESNVFLFSPPHVRHSRGAALRGEVFTVAGCPGSRTNNRKGNSNSYPLAKTWQARYAMGIDWMVHAEITQAIPPAYTEFLGKQVLAYLCAMRGETAA